MKVIIIHDGKKDSSTMANQLNAVISQFDDISTTVWTEKQYLDNKPTLASDEYLLFLGKTKTGKDIIESPLFKNYYSEFNMRYGWLGKQAVIGLSQKFDFNEEELSEFSNLYNATFHPENEPILKEKTSHLLSNLGKQIKSGAATGIMTAACMVSPGLFIGAHVITAGTYLIRGRIDKTKLNKDANALLLKKFVDEGLKEFLNIKE